MPTQQPMAFYHKDGLPSAWQFASRYAGEGGRIATLPDLIEARIATQPGQLPWERYFTTASAEYFGRTRGGNWVLIVAHGVGPMADLDGIMAAYSHEYKDKDRNNRGGRITQQQFWDLEAGKYGEVVVVPLELLAERCEYPFHERFRADEVLQDPLLVARLGPQAQDFVLIYRVYASMWHQEQYGIDPENVHGLPNYGRHLVRRRHQHLVNRHNPFLIFSSGASNCSYGYLDPGAGFTIHHGKDEVIAHVLSIGQIMQAHHDGLESLVTDIRCHEWWNGVRLVGVPQDAEMGALREGPGTIEELIRQHWRKLLEPVSKPTQPGFRALMELGGGYFTQYRKRGDSLDTNEPEYEVTEYVTVGLPVDFEVPIIGHESLFAYGIAQVQAIAPRSANAYRVVGSPTVIRSDHGPIRHRAKLQFYRIEVNNSVRVRRADQLARDFETTMELVN